MSLIIPVLVGLIMGVSSGLMGVGGGIILIPMLVLGLGKTQHLAQGISLAVIIPTAISGLITFHRKGLVDYPRASLLAIGAVVGAICSAGYVQYIPAAILKKVFGVVLVIIGASMLLSKSKPRLTEHIEKETEEDEQK
jgi:hypothetical protein